MYSTNVNGRNVIYNDSYFQIGPYNFNYDELKNLEFHYDYFSFIYNNQSFSMPFNPEERNIIKNIMMPKNDIFYEEDEEDDIEDKNEDEDETSTTILTILVILLLIGLMFFTIIVLILNFAPDTEAGIVINNIIEKIISKT